MAAHSSTVLLSHSSVCLSLSSRKIPYCGVEEDHVSDFTLGTRS